MSNKITIKDIARVANVSPGTVQRALNNFGRISIETKERVTKIAKELGYEPSYIAQSLATGKTYTIGIICPSIGDNVFSSIINEIEDIAKDNGYCVTLGQSRISLELENEYLDLMVKRHVDGIIIVPYAARDIKTGYDKISEVNKTTPIVVIEQAIPKEDLNVIVTDNFKDSYIMTEHLIKSGYKKIAFFDWTAYNWDFSQMERSEGYKKAIKDHELKEYYYKIYKDRAATEPVLLDKNIIKNILETDKPEAVFVQHDSLALNVMNIIHTLGYKVPDDIAVVGFDDIASARYSYPPLTTIKQPAKQIGNRAINILLNNINGKKVEPVRERINGQLIIRESSIKK